MGARSSRGACRRPLDDGAMRSRTEYSARNTTVSMVCSAVTIVAGYFVRVVFTHELSAAYVGVNGLFTDIISILSLSELGIETAVTYALYRPIADGDEDAQRAIMGLYAKAYRVVAAVVLALGLALMPFLPALIPDYGQIPDLNVIYLMYVANSALSYLFVYRRTIIDAHQLRYVTVLYVDGFLLLQYALQALVLVKTRQFVPYLAVAIACTVAGNVAVSRRALRTFPFLAARTPVPRIARSTRDAIVRDIKALFLHRGGKVLINNTDNLVITYFCGIVATGVYSNYYLIIGSIRQVCEAAFRGVAASVGNLGATTEADRVQRVLEASLLVTAWGFGLATICLYELLNPFIDLSFGRQFLYGGDVLALLCVNFYVMGLRNPSSVFHDSLGLFWHDRYRELAEAAVNLAVSIALCARMGVIGVFVGTLVASLVTSSWLEPWVIYRHWLRRSSMGYFARMAGYTGVVCVAWVVTDLVCRLACSGLGAADVATGDVFGIAGSAGLAGDLLLMVVRLAICLVVTNAVMFAALHGTADFRLVRDKLAWLARSRGRDAVRGTRGVGGAADGARGDAEPSGRGTVGDGSAGWSADPSGSVAPDEGRPAAGETWGAAPGGAAGDEGGGAHAGRH
ncbi:MAG: lipopolysaccharide biosynthesis protein [Coriobacteriales bacterium]